MYNVDGDADDDDADDADVATTMRRHSMFQVCRKSEGSGKLVQAARTTTAAATTTDAMSTLNLNV